jgi:DNA-binding transcriptional MocR family regulator
VARAAPIWKRWIGWAVHNPTGYTLHAGVAYDVLRLAERHDFLIVEDDTYGDLHAGQALKLAALDGLQRVIHLGGYSKMLAAGLRVGYLAASAELLRPLANLKALTSLTTPEMGERVVHRVLAEGQYRRHVERVRGRVNQARQRCLDELAALGVTTDSTPNAGMFVWGNCGCDTEALARDAAAHGLLLAPGTLFSPTQMPSTHIRFSVAMAEQPEAWRILAQLLSARA